MTTNDRSACSAHDRPQHSGRPAGDSSASTRYFFQIRAGQIARAWGLEDTHSRLEQLGLRE
jgi:hypothetical protein